MEISIEYNVISKDGNFLDRLTSMAEAELAAYPGCAIHKVEKRVEITIVKPKLWEPKGGDYYITRRGDINAGQLPPDCRLMGGERSSKSECKLLRNRTARSNRLSALANELGGERDWVYGEDNASMYKDGSNWGYCVSSSTYRPDAVYMTMDCAKKICKMLNSGEAVLDFKAA